MYRSSFVAILALAVLGGCDTTATQPESQVVVEAYLEASAPLPTVRVTRTADADEAYVPEELGIEGAEVAVQRLGSQGAVLKSVSYGATDSTAGLYAPEASVTVEPKARYQLRVVPPGGETITATTTVPGATTPVQTANDTTTYPSDDQPDPPQFTFTIDPGTTTADRQNVYILTSRSLLDFQNTPDTTLQRLLTPFYQEDYDAEDDTLASQRVNSSGLLNEANFGCNSDGTVTVRLPWLAVAFYGPNRIGASVVDNNYYDFLRTQSAQQRSLAPGEVPSVINHVDGGTGVFGSYARADAVAFIRPPEGFAPEGFRLPELLRHAAIPSPSGPPVHPRTKDAPDELGAGREEGTALEERSRPQRSRR